MTNERIGILHPGAMGVFVAASALRNGNSVYWVSESRSEKTRDRADQYGLLDAGSLSNLCKKCSIVISVCPPHAAEDVAFQVLECGFEGIYVEANAISPQKVIRISGAMTASGLTFVDGGIVGNPAWKDGETSFYLSGEAAPAVAACFSSGSLVPYVLNTLVGTASGIKMCYGAYTKGTTALLCTILAAAENMGVRGELEAQWARDWPGFDEKTRMRVRRVTAKAWRFAGEMDEISETFRAVGLPGEFHEGAAEIYRRLTAFKDAETLPQLDDVLNALLLNHPSGDND